MGNTMSGTNPGIGDAHERALGTFLRSRRERLSPQSVGLPGAEYRRTPGLRREEVAALSGMSLTWYTWLEQGRHIKVSRQVLSALARTLQLSESEQLHMYRLAGEVPPAVNFLVTCPQPDQQLLDVLNAVEPNPAFLLDRHWDIVGWNRAEAALFTDFGALPVAHRNMLWLIFCWPQSRTLLVDWERQAAPVLAQFRMVADEHPADPRFAEIIAELSGTAMDFDSWWERHEVATYQPVLKEFDHRVGRLTLRQSKLIAADTPELHVVLRFPADKKSGALLRRLVSDE